MKVTGTHIESSIPAEGCIIHASRIANSVIGIRADREGSEIEVPIMGSDYYETLPKSAYSASGVFPSWVSAGVARYHMPSWIRIAGSATTNHQRRAHLPDSDHALFTVKDGIVVIKKGAILPTDSPSGPDQFLQQYIPDQLFHPFLRVGIV